MEIGVSPLVPSCNRVTVDAAALTIRFADTIDQEIARRDASKAFAKLNDATGGLEVMATLHSTENWVRIESRPGCDEDVAGDQAIELFSAFVRGSLGESSLATALNASGMTSTFRIKPSPSNAMAVKKAEIARLIAKLQEQVAAMPTDAAKWGNVGDAGYVVEQLADITATFNGGEPV